MSAEISEPLMRQKSESAIYSVFLYADYCDKR
jgi:hypothetical protein